MKRVLFIIIVSLSVQSLSAQSSFSEIKKQHSWACVGIDFSNVKFLGRDGFNNPQKIVEQHFLSINQLLFNERDKYNIKKAFKLKNHFFLIGDYFDIKNTQIETENIFADRSYILDYEKIEKIIVSYNFHDIKQDIVLLFIAERLDKVKAEGVFWVTLINSKTKEIILTERIIGKPGGIGFRNYWTNAVYDIIKQIKKKKYKQWKKR
jgi:hypothetical protein